MDMGARCAVGAGRERERESARVSVRAHIAAKMASSRPCRANAVFEEPTIWKGGDGERFSSRCEAPCSAEVPACGWRCGCAGAAACVRGCAWMVCVWVCGG